MDEHRLNGETVDQCLAKFARRDGSKTLLAYKDQRFSYADIDERANSIAGGFKRLGVSKGEAVCLLLPNCPEYLFAWMALARLGAVTAGLNTEYRGSALAHLVSLTNAEVLVVDAEFAERIASIVQELGHVSHIVYRAPHDWAPPAELAHLPSSRFDDLRVEGYQHVAGVTAATDALMLLFTSGTTGPAKAVEVSHGYALDMALDLSTHFAYGPEDVIYTAYPLFHTDAAIVTFLAALSLGATAVISDKFSASRFWDEVREYGVTITDFIGAAMVFLYKQPVRPDDADNPLRFAISAPTPPFYKDFEKRFGVRLAEVYGATECGHPIKDPVEGDELHRDGSCGKATDRFEVRIVDENDEPAADGEIVVRPKYPNQHMSGYLGDPAATVRAWRNLWYHTGDRGRIDEDGWIYCAGRIADSIRKRGHNMSAYEIEDVLIGHPSIVEVSAIGVPSEFTEEEVKVVVVPVPGSELTHHALAAWCAERMPKYMVPRYVEFAGQLPKGPTGKVNKNELRSKWSNEFVVDVTKDQTLTLDA